MTITVPSAAICQGRAAEDSEGIVMVRNPRPQESDDGHAAEYTEQYLLDRLIAAGVGCLDDWRALSPRARRNIFGITSSMARALDRMAKAAEAPPRKAEAPVRGAGAAHR